MSRVGRVTPFLWYDGVAEEAAHFYVSLFDDSRVVDPVRTPAERAAGEPPLVVTFELEGRRLRALNGGPQYRLNEAFSLHVECADQAEVDHYWERLTDGGRPGRCGWLVDRYGLSWQVVPRELPELLFDPDPERAARVRQAMHGMDRLDLAALRAARARPPGRRAGGGPEAGTERRDRGAPTGDPGRGGSPEGGDTVIGPVSPFFRVTDVRASVAFYCDRLGFELRHSAPVEDPFFAVVGRGSAQLLLKDPRQSASERVQPQPNRRQGPGAPWDAFVFASDPEALAADFESRGLTLAGGVHERSDGLRGFEVRDPDGYVLFFGRPV